MSELITQPSPASDERTTSTDRITRKHIALLWERMGMIYGGNRWVSNFGVSDDGDTWFLGLRDLTEAQLITGIEKCVASGEDWPPSLAIFRDRCLPPKKESLPPYLRDQTVSGNDCAFVHDGKCRGNATVRVNDSWLCGWHYENRFDDKVRDASSR